MANWMGWVGLLGLSVASHAGFAAADARDPAKLDKVVVLGERQARQSEASEETEKLLKVPGSFGDPLQSVYNLPGIVQTEEIGGAPAVRGSGPDDNAFLIDFLPAGYVFHDFGFSIFNENLLRDFGLKTAGFGSRYGKATGAIFDVTLREPRQQPWAFTVDSSFLRVGAMAEGAITDRQAAYVSIRESLIHLLLKLRADTLKDEEDISFQEYPRARDFQAKYSWLVNEYNRVSFLGLGAQDSTEVLLGNESDIALLDPGSAGKARLKTGFGSVGINWIFDDTVNRLQAAMGYLDESRHLSSGGGAEFSNTDIDRLTFKSHYQRRLGNAHTAAIGGEWQRSNYHYDLLFRFRSCTNFTPDCRLNRGPLTAANDVTTIDTLEGFVEDRWQIVDSIALTLGLHTTQNDYLHESYREPRLASEWQLNPRWGVHASWGKYHQLPRIGQIIPVFGNSNLVSPSAMHYVFGATYRANQAWSWNTDVYYKQLRDLVVDVATGEQYLNRATGRAYGAELMIEKRRDPGLFESPRKRGAKYSDIGWLDRIDGWFALSLSKSERRNQINGVTAVFEYDTPVIANLVLNYRITGNWEAGLRWNLRSGLPYTPIVGNKPNPDFPGFYLPMYGELNGARASPYHRLDLRIERSLRFGRFRGGFYVDIINAYARQNGGAVEYKPVPGSSDYKLEEADSLPLLPSVGIKLTF